MGGKSFLESKSRVELLLFIHVGVDVRRSVDVGMASLSLSSLQSLPFAALKRAQVILMNSFQQEGWNGITELPTLAATILEGKILITSTAVHGVQSKQGAWTGALVSRTHARL